MLGPEWCVGLANRPRPGPLGRFCGRLKTGQLILAQGKRCKTIKINNDEAIRRRRAAKLIREKTVVTRRGENSGPYSSKLMRRIEDTGSLKIGDIEQLPDAPGVLAKIEQVLGETWGQLEPRYRIVVASSLAFVLCNLDKVNMSVAIIPMAREFGWGPSVSGLVQSGFFWGYILSQLPGGYLCNRFSGRKVLPSGVGMWSLATVSVPLVASTVPGLCIARAAVGLGEAVAPSAITDMVARSVPKSERSRAIAFIFGGLHVGSITGLLLAPFLIEHFGWQSVFLFSGGSAVIWVVWWEKLVAHMKETDPEVFKLITEKCNAEPSEQQKTAQGSGDQIPWRAILRSQAVRALMFTHFCNNWFQYTFLAWLPSYFTDTLSLDLPHAARVSLLPPIAGILTSFAAGPLADALIANGWRTATVRKVAQCTAFLGPAACLLLAANTSDSTWTVGLVTSALGLASFAMAGLYCNHQDLSPKYASFLLGLTNTTGAVPGIVGVIITGFLLDRTGSWPIALFAPSVFLFIAGSVVFTLYGRSDLEAFSDNRPFELEEKLKAVFPWNAQ